MLVDLDLIKELRYKISVERVGFAFFMEIEYERLSKFSNYCNCIGHYLGNYKIKNLQDNENKKEEKMKKVYARETK